MKKQILIATLLGTALLSCASSSVMAQPASAAPCAEVRHGMMHFADAENLSPEKKDYLKKALKELRDQIRPQMGMLRAKEAALRAELMQPTVDRKHVDDFVKEIDDLRAKILQEGVTASLKIKDNTGVSIPFPPSHPRHHSGQHHS